MKLSYLVSSIALVALSSSVFAADGTVEFTGSITANTCTIDGSAGSATKTVTLGDIPASALSTAGQTAGNKTFSFTLTNCTAGASKVAARFESLVASSDGYLSLTGTGTAGVAENVQIGIYDAAGLLQPVNGAVPATSYVDVVGNDATLNYTAAYYATGEATVGTANSQVAYTLSYQ